MSIFEWPFYTGFTVLLLFACNCCSHDWFQEMLRSWETTSLALELLEALNSFLASGEFYSLLITFANSLDPEQDQQNAGLDQNPNHLIVFLKEFMETVNFEKSQHTTTKA